MEKQSSRGYKEVLHMVCKYNILTPLVHERMLAKTTLPLYASNALCQPFSPLVRKIGIIPKGN